MYSLAGKKIWVTGHRGMVGSAIVRRLAGENCRIFTAGREKCDLVEQAAVRETMLAERPEVVVVVAGKVGGILANDSYPAEFIYENMMIEANLIHSAHLAGVEKLLFLGSSCIYPKFAEQPIREESLLAGPLEPTNEWYAIAKIAGIKLCQAYRRQHGCDFISAMPTNLYGPGDRYDLETSHVLPALLRKAHEAKLAGAECFEIWGSGTPRREFMHVDDLADACVFLLKTYSDPLPLNIGFGDDVTIGDLAELVARTVGFPGTVTRDTSKPDGTPRKLMDSSRLAHLGWRPRIQLEEGVADAYRHFLSANG
jgi:GDP-L-fucose synthase